MGNYAASVAGGISRLIRREARISAPGMATLDRALGARSSAPPDPALEQIVKDAWATGCEIDVAGAVYGPAHWNGSFHDKPFPYYNFLAGFVRTQDCLRIFEVGSHYGGSCLSMLRGVHGREAAKIVTVDVTDLNPALHAIDGVTKITGNANHEATLKQALLEMGPEPIDLLYVDANHRFLPTLNNLGLYVFLLRPRFVIIDDIALNAEMRTLWGVIRGAYGAAAVNCVDVEPDIRQAKCGFGLVRLR